MILEGIITTTNDDGSVNISPMGPLVDDAMRVLVLRPYQTSTTYRNLKRTGQAVFHVTDDVELLAHAAVGTPDPLPPLEPATAVAGWILTGACRWYALGVRSLDDRQQRTEIVCDVVDQGHLRDFFGFNRAKHAVVEAAILATRKHLLDADFLRTEFERLQVPIDKTGSPAEHRAFEFLKQWITASVGEIPKSKIQNPKSSAP
ncbi:MAG: DUF447 domain-containing protein [Pirellulales bacterium]